MKKSILSFDQAILVQDGVTVQEVIFLDWFLQFFGSPAMQYIQEDGVLYGKIRRSYVIEQLPILQLTSEKSITRMISSLIEKGYLRKLVRTNKDGKSTLYLSPGDRAYEAAGIRYERDDSGDDDSLEHIEPPATPAPDVKRQTEKRSEAPPIYEKILEEWEKLGNKVVQPPNKIHFLNKAIGEIAPHIRGVHSSDILQSIQNFGKTLDDPRSYWKAKISVYTFFQKHFEKFLPANYDPEAFLDSKISQKIREERAHKEMVRRIMERPL